MSFLIDIYVPICSAVFLGGVLSFLLSLPWVQRRCGRPIHEELPAWLGQFLFLIGIPISIINFLRGADLSGGVFLAPLVAWGAIALAFFCSRLWLQPQLSQWPRPAQGAFSLVSMFGNTGYIGLPVILLLPQLGQEYFGWALFYDVLGTLLGVFIVGVLIAAQFGQRGQPLERNWRRSLAELGKNPTILAFIVGLLLRSVPFPLLVDVALRGFAWSMVMLALGLMGMRLQQLRSWGNVKPAAMALALRMLLIPLVVGMALTTLGMTGPPRLVMVLQAGMPSAFATLVLSENYNLDRELAVTCLGLSSAGLLLTLPLWLWGFCTW